MSERKGFKVENVEIKDAEKGLVQAVIATLNVKDKDNDFTLPGAFGKQNVKISAYGHGSWEGSLPVGKGTVSEKSGKAVADLKFFMSTATGREHFEVIKEMGSDQEWSYGFTPTETGEITEELRQNGVTRVLKSVDVHEVSPVLRGAGVDTRTVSVKCDACAAKERGEGGEPEEPEVKSTKLGELLKSLRDEKELSNGDLAQAMGTSASEVGRIIDGEVGKPSLKRLEAAAKVLGTSLGRLRGAAESDGHDYTDEDEMRSRGASADEARAAAVKAEELAKSAEAEARTAIEAKTAAEAAAALERAESFQTEAKSEFSRFNRNMERYLV